MSAPHTVKRTGSNAQSAAANRLPKPEWSKFPAKRRMAEVTTTIAVQIHGRTLLTTPSLQQGRYETVTGMG